MVNGSLLPALVTVAWTLWRRDRSGQGDERLSAKDGGLQQPIGLTDQAQLLFAVLTLSLAIATVIVLVLWPAGIGSASPDRAVRALILYGSHLYLAGFLMLGLSQVLSWLNSGLSRSGGGKNRANPYEGMDEAEDGLAPILGRYPPSISGGAFPGTGHSLRHHRKRPEILGAGEFGVASSG